MTICYLCGTSLIKNVNKTRDHIPPECIFPAGTNNITVLCCKDCNEEYDPLDEKIRNHMASLFTIPTRPIEKGHRAVLQSQKLAKEYLSYTQEHPTLKGKNGEPRLIYYFNKVELDKWLIRIVKGLYFHEKKKRINEQAKFEPKAHPEIYPPKSGSFPLEEGLERRPYFTYSFQENISINEDFWLFMFYDKLLFSVIVKFPN